MQFDTRHTIPRFPEARDGDLQGIIASLPEHLFFRLIPSLDPATIVTQHSTQSYPAGSTIFSFGDEPDGAYLVLKGRIDVTAESPVAGKPPLLIARYEDGSFLGAYGALDGGRRDTTATATTETILTFIPSLALKSIVLDQARRSELRDFIGSIIRKVVDGNECFSHQAAEATMWVALAALNHNIKNPLCAITAAPERLEELNPSLQSSGLTRDVASLGRRLSSLIDEVMNASLDLPLPDNSPLTPSAEHPTHSPIAPDARLLSALGHNKFFDIFPRENPSDFFKNATVITFSPGQLIYRQGEPLDSFYFHLEGGGIEVTREAINIHKEIRIATRWPGDFLGHYAIFNGSCRSASARATTEATMLRVPATYLDQALDRADSRSLIELMKGIINAMRRDNRLYAHYNRLEEVCQRALIFARQALPIIHSINEKLDLIGESPGLRDPNGLILRMRDSTTRLDSLISDLDVCAAREASLVYSEVNVSDLLETTRRRFGTDFDRLGLKLELRSINTQIFVDKQKIQSVVEKLVLNAQEAHNSGAGSVDVIATDLGDSVQLVIADTGSGLPPAIRKHLFEIFWTEGKVTSGQGLGLAFCKTVIDAHGGSIEIVDRPEGGTRVILTIPRHPPRGVNTEGGADARPSSRAL